MRKKLFPVLCTLSLLATGAIADDRSVFVGKVGAVVALTKRCPILFANVEGLFAEAKKIGVSLEGPIDGLSEEVAAQADIWSAGLAAIAKQQACIMAVAMFGDLGTVAKGYVGGTPAQ